MSDDERHPDSSGEWRTDESWTGGMDPTVPALCERCWFPILPGQTARRTPVHVSGPRFTARLVSFVHCAPVCTPQDDDEHGSEAA
ncbi:MAG TPA: hypothetical protein VGH76_21370 [Actinomycetospora sp.]|uniref:hypothetical protein n=1 Tax=Actinomycetospora sp. TaxID=1872135 RepID=UPI002F3E90DD